MKHEQYMHDAGEKIEQALAGRLEGPVTRDVLRAYYAGRQGTDDLRNRVIGFIARLEHTGQRPQRSDYTAGYDEACRDHAALLKAIMRGEAPA